MKQGVTKGSAVRAASSSASAPKKKRQSVKHHHSTSFTTTSKYFVGDNDPKRIEQIDPHTGEVLKIHESIKSACRFLGRENSAKSIRDCLSGKARSAFGFFWRRCSNNQTLVAATDAKSDEEE